MALSLFCDTIEIERRFRVADTEKIWKFFFILELRHFCGEEYLWRLAGYRLQQAQSANSFRKLDSFSIAHFNQSEICLHPQISPTGGRKERKDPGKKSFRENYFPLKPQRRKGWFRSPLSVKESGLRVKFDYSQIGFGVFLIFRLYLFSILLTIDSAQKKQTGYSKKGKNLIVKYRSFGQFQVDRKTYSDVNLRRRR